MMNRREFIGGTVALAAVRALSNRNRAPEFRARAQFGYAAITWGGNDRAAMDDISATGFRGIQLRASAVTSWSKSPDQLGQLLAARQLTFVALSSGTLRFKESFAAADIALHVRNAEFVRDAGGRYLQLIDERPVGYAPAPDDYRRMGRLLTEIGRRTADLGVAVGYHNHMGALGQSPDEVARVLDAADPRYVKLELDIAHYQAAGGDPAKAVRDYHDRLLFLHLKDLQWLPPTATAAHPYRFVELGRGVVNVNTVLAELDRAQFGGWAIVELDAVTDAKRSAKESALISRSYLESNGYTI